MTFKKVLQNRAVKAKKPRSLGKLSPYQVLGKPIVTEKAYKMVEDMNIYTFHIHNNANKNDVVASLQAVYDITPKSVRTMTVVRKGRMNRKLVRRAYRKAYVTLKKGDSIELTA